MPELEEFYRQKVSSFLKTIVCFDDEAQYGCILENEEKVKVAKLQEDGFSGEAEDSSVNSDTDKNNKESQVDKNCLDAKALMDAFAKEAILCSVIKPSGDPAVIETQIINLAQAADVLILDWFLANKNPTIAKSAIINILAKDKENGGRLRLIVIYSVQTGIDVIDELDKALDSFKKSDDGLQLQDEHTLIVFFQKPGTIKATQIVEYENLPQSVIDSFTILTSGLLPAAALTAISAIREKTHHLLATFPADLDGAFLTHRCLIPDPNDSELFLIDLIESEIGTLLRQRNVWECIDAERCRIWIESKIGDESKEIFVQAITEYSEDKLEKLRKGLSIAKSSSKRKIGDKVSDILCRANNCDPNKSKEDLSILSTIDIPRRHEPINTTKHTPPRLKLGVVVKDEAGKYMLCIQPLCDSVRISYSENTGYPFLMLINQTATNKGFELCVPPQDGVSPVIWLGISPIPKNIITYPFKSKSDREAYVEGPPSENNSFIFKTENGQELEWVAQIKIGKAQRIVSQLAARIHTLGIDEFEWMRLHQ